jgi:hypothetical protein
MGLKDIGKIVANQGAQAEDARAEANTPATPSILGKQWEPNIDLSKHEPANTSGHRGFKYDGSNPFHKDFLTTLLKSGDAGKVVIHEGGKISVPRDVALKDGISNKFEVSSKFAEGGEDRYPVTDPKPSTAVVPAPRKSEKDSKKPGVRPAAPRPTKPVGPATKVAKAVASDPKSEIASLFVGGSSRTDPELAAKAKAREDAAAAAEKAARLAARKKALEED